MNREPRHQIRRLTATRGQPSRALRIRSVTGVIMLWATVCAAAGRPTVTVRIAAVLLQFEHVCTPAQSQMLEEISRAADTPAAGRTMALAVMRLLHTPHPDDFVSLERITADPTLPEDMRQLAAVIRRFVHRLTPADRMLVDRIAHDAPDGRSISACSPGEPGAEEPLSLPNSRCSFAPDANHLR
jgi:hypothetical protein